MAQAMSSFCPISLLCPILNSGMTWIIVPDTIPTSPYLTLILSNVLSASVSWGIARWYYKQEVIYSYITPWNMIFVSTLTVVTTCLVMSAPRYSDGPQNAWHDEAMIQHVREIRTNIRAHSPDHQDPPTPVPKRQSPVRHSTQEAQLIAAGYTHTFRSLPASAHVNRRQSYIAIKRGRETGIFENWEEARKHVDDSSGAEHMAFRRYDDAARWLLGRMTLPP